MFKNPLPLFFSIAAYNFLFRLKISKFKYIFKEIVFDCTRKRFYINYTGKKNKYIICHIIEPTEKYSFRKNESAKNVQHKTSLTCADHALCLHYRRYTWIFGLTIRKKNIRNSSNSLQNSPTIRYQKTRALNYRNSYERTVKGRYMYR